MKRIILAVALSAGCIGLYGCHVSTTTTATAPTLSNGYSKAAVAMQGFSADVLQAQQIEIELYREKLPGLDSPTHVAIQDAFLQVSGYGKQIDALILSQASATTIQAKVTQALGSVTAIANSTGKLDPTTSANLNLAVAAIQAILQSVSTSIQQ